MINWLEIASVVFFSVACLLVARTFCRRSVGPSVGIWLVLAAGWVCLSGILILKVLKSPGGGVATHIRGDVFVLLSWILAGLTVFVRFGMRLTKMSFLLFPFLLVSSVMVIVSPIRLYGVSPSLPGFLFVLHVGVLLLSLSSFCVALVSAWIYVLVQRQLKLKILGTFFTELPALETAQHVIFHALFVGWLLLTLGMGSGIYLAHEYWRTDWINDSRFILTTATWVWYFIVLGLHRFRGWCGTRLFVLIATGLTFFALTLLISIIGGIPWS